MKKDFYYIVAIIVLGILLVKSCDDKNKTEQNLTNTIQAMNDSVEYYNNKLGQEVAEKKAFIGTKKELIEIIEQKDSENKQLQIALKKFKKPKTITQTKTLTKLDTITIYHTDTIPYVFTRDFTKETKHYSIDGRSTQKGITLNKVKIPNEQIVVVGEKKIGWFKKEFRVEVTNTNPYIKVKDTDAFSFDVSERKWGIGIIGGYGIDSQLQPTPFIGVGVSYDFIKF